MTNYHDFISGKCVKCGTADGTDDECHAWVVQIQDGDDVEEIGYAETSEQASALAMEHGYSGNPKLYARLDYCEWHVGFE